MFAFVLQQVAERQDVSRPKESVFLEQCRLCRGKFTQRLCDLCVSPPIVGYLVSLRFSAANYRSDCSDFTLSQICLDRSRNLRKQFQEKGSHLGTNINTRLSCDMSILQDIVLPKNVYTAVEIPEYPKYNGWMVVKVVFPLSS